MFCELLEISTRLKQEHAAIPEVSARCQKTLRRRTVGFFDESIDVEGLTKRLTATDVAIARLRSTRNHPERDKLPLLSHRNSCRNGRLECGFVLDDMIGREHE